VVVLFTPFDAHGSIDPTGLSSQRLTGTRGHPATAKAPGPDATLADQYCAALRAYFHAAGARLSGRQSDAILARRGRRIFEHFLARGHGG